MGHAPTELGDRMQITEVVALSAALITGMVASLCVVVWQSLRQRWAALYAAAFFVFFVTYVFDARMQPIEGRPNPWSATLALLDGAVAGAIRNAAAPAALDGALQLLTQIGRAHV